MILNAILWILGCIIGFFWARYIYKEKYNAVKARMKITKQVYERLISELETQDERGNKNNSGTMA